MTARYQVRPRSIDQCKQAIKNLVEYIKKNENKSGIIYCLTRKKVDELTNLLNLNNINAVAYHAGLDKEIRSKNKLI